MRPVVPVFMLFAAGVLHAGQTPPVTARVLTIAGGSFEPSGVQHVPGTSGVLFVDDDSARQVYWMELTDDGRQKGSAVPITLGADVMDPEGLTFDGSHYYVVGSQSKFTGFEGDGLVRFTFDAKTRRVGNVERVRGLKRWLAEHVPELRGTALRIGDHVLNIEGLAWDPTRSRLLLGLRAPVVDGQTLIVPVTIKDRTRPFRADNLEAGPTIRLALAGAGIRSIEYDVPAKMFRVITGAALNVEDRSFRVLEWDGGAAVRELRTYPAALKPEGFTRVALAGRAVGVVVFDVGSFALME